MSNHKKILRLAIKEVIESLSNMPQEDFDAEVGKNLYKDKAFSLLYAWSPDEAIQFSKVMKVITRCQEVEASRKFFTEGGCYLFYRLLKSYFKDAEAYYDQDHIITKIGATFYDITGVVDGSKHLPLKVESVNFNFFEPLENL